VLPDPAMLDFGIGARLQTYCLTIPAGTFGDYCSTCLRKREFRACPIGAPAPVSEFDWCVGASGRDREASQ
jgi:hypothetical protein